MGFVELGERLNDFDGDRRITQMSKGRKKDEVNKNLSTILEENCDIEAAISAKSPKSRRSGVAPRWPSWINERLRRRRRGDVDLAESGTGETAMSILGGAEM